MKGLRETRTLWFLVGTVALCVFLILLVVFNHEREKPKSPQALVAAAFHTPNVFSAQEWQPGMGPQPFMYHPAGFKSVVWRPLPSRVGSGLGPVGNTGMYPGGAQPLHQRTWP